MPKTFDDLIKITANAERANVSLDDACATYDIDPQAVAEYSKFAIGPLVLLGLDDPHVLFTTAFIAGLIVARSIAESASQDRAE